MPRRGIIIKMKSRVWKFYAIWILALLIGLSSKSLRAEIDTNSFPVIGEGEFEFQNDTNTNISSMDSDQPGPKSSRAYIRHAAGRAGLGDYNGALADLNKAIELNPKSPSIYCLRAVIEHRLGYEDLALADCSRAIKLNPKFARAYNDRGIVEMDTFRDFEAAMTDFNEAIKLAPNASPPYVNRAWVKRRLKDTRGAIKDLNRVIQLNPRHASAYALLGCIQNDLFQFQDALESFRKAVEIDSSAEYCRIRIWLIRVRLGERAAATKELVSHLHSLPRAYMNRWPMPVEYYLTDLLSEEDFLKNGKISPQNAWIPKRLLSEVNYYVGMKHLLAGDKAVASIYFQKALDSKLAGDSEYESAAAELRAINGQ